MYRQSEMAALIFVSMLINNFNVARKWVESLKSADDFYFVEVMQRIKDWNLKNNVIKHYIIYNIKDLEQCKAEIISLCRVFNARAYMWINPRNLGQMHKNILRLTVDAMDNHSNNIYRIVSKALGVSKSNDYPKKWILDFDTKDKSLISKYLDILMNCRPTNTGSKVYEGIETINGWHIITKEFDTEQFSQELAIAHLDNIDIHKDSPTLIYYEH